MTCQLHRQIKKTVPESQSYENDQVQDDNSSLFGDSDTPDPAGLTAPLLTSQISSHETQSTITLSSPSQKLTDEFKECDYSLATSTEDKEV